MVGTRILVVEDEKIVAKDIQFRLRGLGFEVTAIAASGEEAIDMARKHDPDLILMDIRLKGEMDGVEAAHRIKEFMDVPIIFLTAYSDRKTLERAKFTDPFGYILKPFEDRDLYTGIEMALNKHRLQREVRERERWLATVLRSIADAVITTDTEGIVTFLNPVAEDLTGWRLEEARGHPITDIFHVIDERTGEPIGDPVKDVLNGRSEPDIMVQPVLISRDGREQIIEYRGSPITDENDAIGVVMVVFHDVTERRRAEKALMESLQTSADIVSALPIGLLIFQREPSERLVLVEGNAAAEGLMGTSIGALISRDIRDLFPPDGGGVVVDDLRRVVEEGGIFDRQDVRLDTDLLKGYYTIRAFRLPGGRLGVALEDVTGRKRAEEMILRSLHEKEVLLKEIHHRVKNNLQIVSSLLHLQAKKVDGVEAQDMFSESMNRIRTMALLHEKLYRGTDLSRIDFEGFVRSIAGYLYRSYGVDPGRVRVDIQVHDVHLPLDTAIPCGFIINELVSNSLKHAFPDGREGTITIQLTGDGVGGFLLVVGDDGVGMSDDVDFDTTDSLGIQLVRSLAEHLNGEVAVVEGAGTVVKVRFRELKYGGREVDRIQEAAVADGDVSGGTSRENLERSVRSRGTSADPVSDVSAGAPPESTERGGWPRKAVDGPKNEAAGGDAQG